MDSLARPLTKWLKHHWLSTKPGASPDSVSLHLCRVEEFARQLQDCPIDQDDVEKSKRWFLREFAAPLFAEVCLRVMSQCCFSFQAQVHQRLPYRLKLVQWYISPQDCEILIIGTSNLGRISSSPIDPSRMGVHSFPGANFQHLTGVLER